MLKLYRFLKNKRTSTKQKRQEQLKVGTPVEVYSDSRMCWAKGRVLSNDGHRVVLEYLVPGGTLRYKSLTADDKSIKISVPKSPPREKKSLKKNTFGSPIISTAKTSGRNSPKIGGNSSPKMSGRNSPLFTKKNEKVSKFRNNGFPRGINPLETKPGSSRWDDQSCEGVSRRGNCPLVLTAPHGGNRYLDDFGKKLAERSCDGNKCCDAHTIKTLVRIRDYIMDDPNGGFRPSTVCLRTHRRYIDCNRSECGTKQRILRQEGTPYNALCPSSSRIYKRYHEEIKAHLEAAEAKFGYSILLDLHAHGGTENDRCCVYVGTKQGRTTSSTELVRFAIQPLLQLEEIEVRMDVIDRLDGGWTVQKHSGFNDTGVAKRVCYQLEFGPETKLLHVAEGLTKVMEQDPMLVLMRAKRVTEENKQKLKNSPTIKLTGKSIKTTQKSPSSAKKTSSNRIERGTAWVSTESVQTGRKSRKTLDKLKTSLQEKRLQRLNKKITSKRQKKRITKKYSNSIEQKFPHVEHFQETSQKDYNNSYSELKNIPKQSYSGQGRKNRHRKTAILFNSNSSNHKKTDFSTIDGRWTNRCSSPSLTTSISPTRKSRNTEKSISKSLSPTKSNVHSAQPRFKPIVREENTMSDFRHYMKTLSP